MRVKLHAYHWITITEVYNQVHATDASTPITVERDCFRLFSSWKRRKTGGGGVLSPVLFCLYIDGLLVALSKDGVGCFVGDNFVGVLAYADDIVLLAPSCQPQVRCV